MYHSLHGRDVYDTFKQNVEREVTGILVARNRTSRRLEMITCYIHHACTSILGTLGQIEHNDG